MDKKQARQIVREQKLLLSKLDCIDKARNVFSQLESLDVFVSAKRVLVYNSLPDELSTREFIARWYTKKSLFLPRVNGDDLEVLPYVPNEIKSGAFKIDEPTGCDIVDIATIDLIVVPAVALDRKCNRVGRGKGFYDRLLRYAHAPKIGVCYGFQLFDEVDVEPHDIPLDVVISPSQVIINKHSSLLKTS